MTIEEKVYALLAADVTIIGIVGDAKRIRIPSYQQDSSHPYIVHFPATDQDTIQVHAGRAALEIWPFYQISCFAKSYTVVCALAAAVVAAIEGNHEGVEFEYEGRHPLYETDTQVHQMVLSFRVAEAL
jgi:hypothetical protein